MRYAVFSLAAIVLLSPCALAQTIVAPPPTARVVGTINFDTNSPSAGRVWATQGLRPPSRFSGQTWEAAANAATRVARITEVLITAINPNNAPTGVRLQCRDTRGRVTIVRTEEAVAAMGATGFSLRTEDFGTAGTLWCEVRGDRPLLVSGGYYMRVMANMSGGTPAAIYEETVDTFQTWMLER
jgi:hypothetical protein